jgi:hypothetical protein
MFRPKDERMGADPTADLKFFDDAISRRIRHGRACPGHPRLIFRWNEKTWMPGTRPGMTTQINITRNVTSRSASAW